MSVRLRRILEAACVLAIGAVTGTCDNFGRRYGVIAFQCDPAGRQPDCPEAPVFYVCCSDDPATFENSLPSFAANGSGTGTPLFSAAKNDVSRSGLCIESDALVAADVLPGTPGCPRPCNPEWSDEDTMRVCGGGTLCCQTDELEPDDCVLADECWRPARGRDIFDAEIQGSWGQGPDPWEHPTAQDPGGQQCAAAAGGDPDIEETCLRRLGVANQHGICVRVGPDVVACPTDRPEYIDACEQRNLDEGRGCPLRP